MAHSLEYEIFTLMYNLVTGAYIDPPFSRPVG